MAFHELWKIKFLKEEQTEKRQIRNSETRQEKKLRLQDAKKSPENKTLRPIKNFI